MVPPCRRGNGGGLSGHSGAALSRIHRRRDLCIPLTGTDFEKEGQRRYAVAACFYLAFLDLYPAAGSAPRRGKADAAPLGMLTGVRPDKPITRALMEGKTPEEGQVGTEDALFRP